eukprot:358307-Chlamydomonas_euryale.AAC.8
MVHALPHAHALSQSRSVRSSMLASSLFRGPHTSIRRVEVRFLVPAANNSRWRDERRYNSRTLGDLAKAAVASTRCMLLSQAIYLFEESRLCLVSGASAQYDGAGGSAAPQHRRTSQRPCPRTASNAELQAGSLWVDPEGATQLGNFESWIMRAVCKLSVELEIDGSDGCAQCGSAGRRSSPHWRLAAVSATSYRRREHCA